MGEIVNVIWILVLLQVFIPLIQQRMQAARRLMAIRTIETRRNSRVITMIHRQETMSLLGLQNHGGKIEFRNIRLRPLPPEEPRRDM